MIKFLPIASKIFVSLALSISINSEFKFGITGCFAVGILSYIIVDIWLEIINKDKP